MSSFPISEAELVAFFMESVTWGIQIVTFTQCVWALFETAKGGPRRVNIILLTWAIALFVWGTLDISFAVYRNLTAFIYYTGPGGSSEIFDEIRTTLLSYGWSVWNFLAILTADMALVRVFNAHCLATMPTRAPPDPPVLCDLQPQLAGHRLPLPHLGSRPGICSRRDLLHLYIQRLTNLAGAAKIEAFLNAFIALGVSLNIITTAIILYRVGQLQNASARMLAAKAGKHDHIPSSGHMRWSQLSQILVESAVVYTLAGIILLVVNFVGSNAVYPMSDLTLQIAGIQYDLIITRICRGVAVEQVHSTVQYPLRDTTYGMRSELPHVEGAPSNADTKSAKDSGTDSNQVNVHDYVATQV
ncbi:uncharacterized protein B0H18DRAFT_1121857 [Fomitopsis serialis]|uniref:uncharacterized protein n=1 Tax=Fomitopsis serialis TaxID=139415 RepID=UPI0020078C9F|nr:uncharacterized protein B0H18DRAFT_1121857 [Neoantrodia serialis]KAH9920623.1 hypothetical protein B0H18DRAFT_1121857 [Neoantrodia serialis]